MNKPVVATKVSSSSSNSKSKKNINKDREKRKLQSTELASQHVSEKGSPTKESSARQYAGIGNDSIYIYAEQSNLERPSEEVCSGLAEDLNYKLRFIIHDALIKARLSGRNVITSRDIEATFDSLNIEKVYGATANPNWINFVDQGQCLSYLEDPEINLIDLAEQESSFVQPGDVIVTRKWLPETKEVSKPLKNYFVTMCEAIVGNDMELRKYALHDISKNTLIGPIIEWFYNFGYFLLSKDITYDCLTLCALELIEALEKSLVANITVSEKILKLLVWLILQRLLKSFISPEVLKPMCYVLLILCARIPLREFVVLKILQKMPDVKKSHFLVPLMTIINSFGIDVVQRVFLPYMNYFLVKISKEDNSELTSAVLAAYNIICKNSCENEEIYEAFNSAFCDELVMYWRPKQNKYLKCSTKPEASWINIKKLLMKTRRYVGVEDTRKKYEMITVFPDYADLNNSKQSSEEIQFRFLNFTPTGLIKTKKRTPTRQIKTEKRCEPKQSLIKDCSGRIMVGKTSLLIPIFQSCRIKQNFNTHCLDHSVCPYVL